MLPTLGTVFGEVLSSFFVMVAAAFVVCSWIGMRWAKKRGLNHDLIIDLALMSVITGVLGARIAHVLFDGMFWDYYVAVCTDPNSAFVAVSQAECVEPQPGGCGFAPGPFGRWNAETQMCVPLQRDCFAWARFWQGGLTWYGGLIFAAAYGVRFLHKNGFPAIKALDMGGMVLPIGQFLGRIGCFLGGCCFGSRTDAAWGVSFPEWSPASVQHAHEHLIDSPAMASLPVIPTQLIEAGGNLLIGAVMIFWLEPRKKRDGQVFVVSFIAYATLRFLVEFLRADDRGQWGLLTPSQWISVLVVVALVIYDRRAARNVPPKADAGGADLGSGPEANAAESPV